MCERGLFRLGRWGGVALDMFGGVVTSTKKQNDKNYHSEKRFFIFSLYRLGCWYSAVWVCHVFVLVV